MLLATGRAIRHERHEQVDASGRVDREAVGDVIVGEHGSYKFGMTEVALNVPLTGWALEAMRSRLKLRHQTAALMHSKIYDPEEALDAGFIDRLVPEGEGFALALNIAGNLSKLPPHSYRETKAALRRSVLEMMKI